MRGANSQPELLPIAGRFMTKIVAERESAKSSSEAIQTLSI